MFFKHISSIWQDKRIYLDYASSTPVDREMVRGWTSIPDDVLASNPSALHRGGVVLKDYLSKARTRVAHVLSAAPEEIIFTSGATESDNLAILGTVRHWLEIGIPAKEIAVVVSDIEHAAVLESANGLGVECIILETQSAVVDPKTIVVPEGARALLISIMFVSNEIGTVQPIKEIAKRVRYLRKHYPHVQIVLHTDATQAPLFYELRIPALGIDMMTLGATKLYTAKGVGMLYKKRALAISPIMYGGGQEWGMRPGTESVELIHKFSHALLYADQHREKAAMQLNEIRDYFETQIEKYFPHITVTAKSEERTPHISHIAIPDFDSELLVIELDARGIAVSAKSACKNEEDTESPIVEKIYGPNVGALRFSFGRTTTKKDIDRAIYALKDVFQKYKNVL